MMFTGSHVGFVQNTYANNVRFLKYTFLKKRNNSSSLLFITSFMLILSDHTDLLQFCTIVFLFFIRNVFCMAFIISRFSSFIIRPVRRNGNLYGLL